MEEKMRFDDAIMLNEIVSKNHIERLTRHFVQLIEEGEVNPLDAIVKMHAVGKLVEGVTKNIMVKDVVKAELERYGTKTVKYEGVTFQLKAVSTKYDYSVCNDPVWQRLKNNADIAAAALKEREEFLKAIPLEGFTQVDPLTGEVCTTVRPEKRSEEGYSITIDK
jgi:phosphoribosylaminoimidazole-succinocarboxamide synthase